MNSVPNSSPPPPPTAPSDASAPASARDHRLAVFAHVNDPHVLAELLIHVLGEHPLDAMLHARRTPAVLPVAMTASQASELVRLLGGLGLRAASTPISSLPDLENPVIVHQARFQDQGFEVLDMYGEPAELVPWEHITVLAIGEVPGEPTQHYPEQGRPAIVSAAPLPATVRMETPASRQLELWMLTRHPRRAFCLDHRRFNYACLGERKTESATANFELFARALVERARSARWTPSTHAYLTHDLHTKYEFASSGELKEQALVHWVISQCASDS